MHHQMQKFGDLGLEWLGLAGCRGIGGHTSRFPAMSGPVNQEKPDIATLFRLASFSGLNVRARRSIPQPWLPPSPTINNR
jgi:hypothetical protein